MKIYRITPLEKKNITVVYDVYEKREGGQVRGWNVEEIYRWGCGYRAEDDPVTQLEIENNSVSCSMDVGDGAQLDDLISVYFNFDANFTDEEKRQIEHNWYEGGVGWLYDGEHDWEVDADSLWINGPVKIDLLDEDTMEALEENITPKKETIDLSWQTVSDQEVSVWPFPTK